MVISKIHTLIFTAIFFTFSAVKANPLVYSIEYKGPSKNAPFFENGTVTGQIFRGGNPAGYFKSKINTSNQFSISTTRGNVAIAIFSVKNANNKNLRCYGNALPGSRKISLHCQ